MENLPIGYRLKRTFHAFNDAVKRKVYRSNINFTNFCILTYLNRNLHCENKKKKKKDICSFTSLKAPTISLTLQNMEQDGYICRSKSNKDSRITFVQLTTKGKEQADMMKLFFQNTDSQIVSKMSKEEYETLCFLLDKIYGYLNDDN